MNKSGQASIEYILLIALVATIMYKGITQIREVFFGWSDNKGAVEMMLEKNIIAKLSSPPDGGFK